MASRPTATIAIALLLSLTSVAVLVMVPGGGRAGGAPQQIHLSWQQKSTTGRMSVVWATDTPSLASQVRLGTTSSLEMSYRSADTLPMPNEAGLYIHHALLTGLSAGTRYYYAVGDNSTGWSPTMSFKTGPGNSGDFSFTAMADMDISSTSAANVARMAGANPAFTLFAGDLRYSNPTYSGAGLWDGWFNQLQPLASKAPLMPSPGNHEYDSGSLTTYLGRFALPGNERHYSFNYSNVHIISLESGTSYSNAVDSTETAWLEIDLKYNFKDSNHPWTVVYFHFSPFSSGNMGNWLAGRNAWSPLFDKYGVELVINGHNHNYERTWPVLASGTVAQKNYTSPKAPVYVVTGGGGAFLLSLSSTQPAWSAYRASAYETLRVAVSGNQMVVKAIRPDGSQLDTFTLTRSTSTSTAPAPSAAKLTVKVRYSDGTAVPYAWVEVWDGKPWATGSNRLLATSKANSTYSLDLRANHSYFARAWGDSSSEYLGEQQVYLTNDTTIKFIDPTKPGGSTTPPSGNTTNTSRGKATMTILVRYPDGTPVPYGWVEVWDGTPWAADSKRLLGTSNATSTYSINLATNKTYYVRAWGDSGTGYLGEQKVYFTSATTVKFVDPTKP